MGAEKRVQLNIKQEINILISQIETNDSMIWLGMIFLLFIYLLNKIKHK